MASFNRILCPIDFDQNSLLALQIACELAHSAKGSFHVLHVAAIAPKVSSFERVEAAVKSRCERLVGRKIHGRARCEVHVTTGNPDVEILQAAKRLRADLIVMATHGWKGFRRLLLGSVAESQRRAKTPA